MSRGPRGRYGAALALSVAVHAAVLLLVWAATRAEALPEMRVYAVDIVSPPPQQEGEPDPGQPSPAEAEPVSEEVPEDEPAPVAEQPAPTPEPSTPAPTRREPEPTPPKPTPQRPEPEKPAPTPDPGRPSTGARPDPTSEGGDALTVKFDGVRCIDPEYCNNIIRQIHRYFRRPAGGAAGEADVYFVIRDDGSVRDLRVISNTGGVPFRLAVLEAVEQAGRNRAFGQLPEAFGGTLPVRFTFRPAR